MGGGSGKGQAPAPAPTPTPTPTPEEPRKPTSPGARDAGRTRRRAAATILTDPLGTGSVPGGNILG
jgi:hypothetical protein